MLTHFTSMEVILLWRSPSHCDQTSHPIPQAHARLDLEHNAARADLDLDLDRMARAMLGAPPGAIREMLRREMRRLGAAVQHLNHDEESEDEDDDDDNDGEDADDAEEAEAGEADGWEDWVMDRMIEGLHHREGRGDPGQQQGGRGDGMGRPSSSSGWWSRPSGGLMRPRRRARAVYRGKEALLLPDRSGLSGGGRREGDGGSCWRVDEFDVGCW